MYPKEYLDFSELVKKYVVLKIMIKVLEHDRQIIKQSFCKLAIAYDDTLNEIQWLIERELRQTKRAMKELGGMVFDEEQQSTVRIVRAKFRGFIYTHRYLNYVLQAEAEQLYRFYATPEKNKSVFTSE